MSPSLLACFDLVFSLRDEQTACADQAMASQALRLTTGDFAQCTAVAHASNGTLLTSTYMANLAMPRMTVMPPRWAA